MAPPTVGDYVQTPLGKGIVRERRRNGAVVVVVGGRTVVVAGGDAMPIDPKRASKADRRGTPGAASEPPPRSGRAPKPAEVDLHGLTVTEAIERTTAAIDGALREGRLQLRVIHGRSGGRVKAAVQRLLDDLPSVQRFALDAANPGVTIVDF